MFSPEALEGLLQSQHSACLFLDLVAQHCARKRDNHEDNEEKTDNGNKIDLGTHQTHYLYR
jgi:hypothetical protein